MPPPIDDVNNWINMFHWIVRMTRHEYEVNEAVLTLTAALEIDCGLMTERIEAIIGVVAESFGLRFPPESLDELLKLEEHCKLASWMKGLYKRPPFISDGFEATCRGMNPACS